ncbi:basic salivary proline-rich protein 2-like [Panthera uncia]|uniref:basic salivary proline-rich protein 2-like n=1 Tax=Panthera uncia TaxID=29064 RepID=UPI0020FFCC31|nr:basic salivary proline-rich protein 2-like [Panthera uncia]
MRAELEAPQKADARWGARRGHSGGSPTNLERSCRGTPVGCPTGFPHPVANLDIQPPPGFGGQQEPVPRSHSDPHARLSLSGSPNLVEKLGQRRPGSEICTRGQSPPPNAGKDVVMEPTRVQVAVGLVQPLRELPVGGTMYPEVQDAARGSIFPAVPETPEKSGPTVAPAALSSHGPATPPGDPGCAEKAGRRASGRPELGNRPGGEQHGSAAPRPACPRDRDPVPEHEGPFPEVPPSCPRARSSREAGGFQNPNKSPIGVPPHEALLTTWDRLRPKLSGRLEKIWSPAPRRHNPGACGPRLP